MMLNSLEAVPVLNVIRRKSANMTPLQRRIAKYVIGSPYDVIKMSITQLAGQTGVRSESSIVKFYKTLGFSGYHDFKVTLATELAGTAFYHTYEDITLQDEIKDIKTKIFHGAVQTLHENLVAVKDETLQRAVELIEGAKRIIFLGYASSGAIAYDAFFKFTRIGLPCYFCMDSHINAVTLSDPRDGDVIFCISYSGESKDVVVPVENARPPAKVIALTGFANSPLGSIADVCITTVTEEMNYLTDVLVTRIVQLAIIETLFVSISLRQGSPSWDKLKKTRQSLSYLKF